MPNNFKLWTFLIVLTLIACNTKTETKESSYDIVQKEKATDPATNNYGVSLIKLKSLKETETNKSLDPPEAENSTDEIKIALTGDYRNYPELIPENGSQGYGVFLYGDSPDQYKILSTVIHVKDTIQEDDAINPEHVIISADKNKDNWNGCLFLFKGINGSAPQDAKIYYHSGAMSPGDVLYDININNNSFDLYAQGTVIFDSTENPRNQNCDDDYGMGVLIKNYSIFMVQNFYQEKTRTFKGQQFVLLPVRDICSNEIPTILFIGDIDGDDLPDFLFEYPFSMGREIILRLSSKGFKDVAFFEDSHGC